MRRQTIGARQSRHNFRVTGTLLISTASNSLAPPEDNPKADHIFFFEIAV
jgi:hypothetical protein